MQPAITHADLGRPSAPGEYACGEARVEVKNCHLEAWAAEPEAAFNTILLTRAGDTTTRLALGTRHA